MESMMTLEWASIDTPVGPVSVACGEAGVAEVRFGAPPGGGSGGNSGSGGSSGNNPGGLVRAARQQLAEYFSGQRQEFDLPIDWSGFGPAQRQVLGLLYDDVGYGETVTYGTLAGRAG